MPHAVVFAFAVQDGLAPVAGAAPADVLARQLPRLLVARLNGNGDRGVRFLPFLGPVDGQRTFLRIAELLEPTVLGQLHKQGDVQLLCDGALRPGILQWRIVDGQKLEVLRSGELAFDPRAPLDVLPRLEFELTELLGWTGRPAPLPPITGEALGWFLVLKDELLRAEAGMPLGPGDPLRAARRCVELVGARPEVQEVVCDHLAHLLRTSEHKAAIGAVLAALVPHTVDVARLERLDALAFAAGDADTATTAACAAALRDPTRAELVERAAALAFRRGSHADVRAVVEAARTAGSASPAALAQLAASCDRHGELAERDALVDLLAPRDDLPVPVVRLVVSFLLERGLAARSRELLRQALPQAPNQAALHFELGRAELLLDAGPAAAAAFATARSLGLSPLLDAQARRFERLAAVPGLWPAAQLIEKALAVNDLAAALAAARALVRRVGPVAEAWYLFGLIQHKLGRLRRAERLLRRAIACDPDSADACNRLGILLVGSGRLDEGHTLLLRAHALAPHDPSPMLHLAQVCAMLGRGDEAERLVERAEQCGADPQLAQAVRAEILAKPA